MRSSFHFYGATILAAALFCVVGCTSSEPTATPSVDEHAGHDHAPGEEHANHDHSGWWCPEHGIPEEVCTRCNSTLIASFKDKADWCDEHDRPDSNCFHCHPDLEQKFAARYEAKYGEKPPTPTDP